MASFRFRRKQLIYLLIPLIVFGFWSWRRSASAPSYQEYVVESNSLSETLELSGEVSAASSATLRFGAGGFVTFIGAKEGDRVQKWQTLASVDSRQLRKVLEQKLNLFAIQRGTFEQTIDDNDNSVPDGELGRELQRLLEKNQYQLENTVLDVEYQDLAIKLSRLSSPMSGILVQAPTSVSNVQVAPTDTWTVVDPTTLEFIADLDETDLARISPGQRVVITLDAFPDEEIVSQVESISYTPKETSTGTTYEVTVTLPAAVMPNLRLGLNGTAEVILEEKPAVITLPISALSYEDSTPQVYLKEGDTYRLQKIETGIENEGIVEIVSGLSEGDHVYFQQE